MLVFFFFSSRRRHTRFKCDWSSDVCSSDLDVVSRPRSTPRDRHPGNRRGRRKTTSRSIPCLAKRPCGVRAAGKRRSGERRVGKEGRSRWSPYHLKKKKITKSLRG